MPGKVHSNSPPPWSGDLQNCVVVLVRPHYAGNVGAVARVMRNMGASQLVLVDPVADPNSRTARKRSTHGEQILEDARIVPDLAAALAGCHIAVGTSARSGELIRSHSQNPRECLEKVAAMSKQSRVALVFGPEPSGLTNEEVTLCQHLICIPTDETYPALNLAQSVGICLYEMRLARLGGTPNQAEASIPADLGLQQRMFTALEASLREIHYLYGEKAATLMHALRRLISRANPDEMEVKLLLGLARQIHWAAAQKATSDRTKDSMPLPEGSSESDFSDKL